MICISRMMYGAFGYFPLDLLISNTNFVLYFIEENLNKV